MRNEFLYWYPVDLRNSAKELIPNHLTFFAFHHAALFPRQHWPKAFSVNGMMQLEGKQMSKSKLIFVTWRDALEKYGADAMRATLTLAASGMDDANWQAKNAEDMQQKIESLFPFVERNLAESERRTLDEVDNWLFSVMSTRIAEVTASLEEMKVRRALAVALLDVWNDVRWYLRRSVKPREQTLKTIFEAWIRLLAPFIPFASEELNRVMGNKGLISIAAWPSSSDFAVDNSAEVSELLITRVIEDARNLLKIIKEPKSRLNIYTTSDQASQFFMEMAGTRSDRDKKAEVIRKFSKQGTKPERIIKLQHELGEDLVTKISEARDVDEYKVLAEASHFLSKEIGLQVSVARAGQRGIHDPANKAKDALPFKPAFLLE
jgi:leucyl-tRNA synthetase